MRFTNLATLLRCVTTLKTAAKETSKVAAVNDITLNNSHSNSNNSSNNNDKQKPKKCCLGQKEKSAEAD